MSNDPSHLSGAPENWPCPRCKAAVVAGSHFCQMCGLRLTGTRFPKLFITQWVLLVVAWLTCAIAWALVLFEVESVIATGPVIFFLGVLLIILGAVSGNPQAVLTGVAHCAVCLLLFFLVLILNWSPTQAEGPFIWMGISYLVIATPMTLWALLQRPRVRPPWECKTCGYALYGLNDARCPECGTAFDPGSVLGLSPPAVVPQG